MKLVESYKEKLLDNDIEKTPLSYINEATNSEVLHNVKIITFENLHLHLYVSLFEEGLIPREEKKSIDGIKKYLNDNTFDKIIINGEEIRVHDYHSYLFYNHEKCTYLVTSYLYHFYSNVIEKYGNDIIYIDFSSIFYQGEIDIDYMNLPYNRGEFEYFSTSSKREFVAYTGTPEKLTNHLRQFIDENGMLISGYHHSRIEYSIPLIHSIKESCRMDMIDSLLSDN